MKLDFLIAASPTAGFFSQIAFFRKCLDRLGPPYSEARLVASFGDHTSESIPERWLPHFSDIDVVWAHEIGAENASYAAQHNKRFEVIRPDADLALLCDADVVLMRRIDELLDELQARPAIAGAIAHYHFPRTGHARDPDKDWPELAKLILGRDIDRPYAYTLMPQGTPPQSPFYVNYGVFAGTPSLLSRFYEKDCELRDSISEHVGDWWGPQISTAFSCVAADLPTNVLPMRFNFPNDPKADLLHPEELEKIAFMHYLRLEEFRREEIFASSTRFSEFLNNSFEGSNEVFRKFVFEVTNGKYPFEQTS